MMTLANQKEQLEQPNIETRKIKDHIQVNQRLRLDIPKSETGQTKINARNLVKKIQRLRKPKAETRHSKTKTRLSKG